MINIYIYIFFLSKCIHWLHRYLFTSGNTLGFIFLLAVQNERDRISCRREGQDIGTLSIDVLMQAEACTHQVNFLLNLLSKHSHL